MKLLIIGQAPAAVKQEVPYDTTYLYTMLEWVGISKEKAQEMFEFEAMTDKFPGHGVNGHKIPSQEEMKDYLDRVLGDKIKNSDKIIVLGNVAKYNLDYTYLENKQVVYLMHPSKRNHNLIFKNKDEIINKLKSLL